MSDYKKELIETYYQSRTLKGFKYGIIKDIYDLISGSYTIEHLKNDFFGWCERNNINPKMED